jgi:hypothetical protein
MSVRHETALSAARMLQNGVRAIRPGMQSPWGWNCMPQEWTAQSESV